MNRQKQVLILYLILTTIVLSIVVQVYWNYKNYQRNKLLFFNQVQSSLDNATDLYYADIAKNRFNFFELDTTNSVKISKLRFENEKKPTKKNFNYSIQVTYVDSLLDPLKNKPTFFRKKNFFKDKPKLLKTFKNDTVFLGDSIKIRNDISTVFISLLEHKMNFKKMDSLLDNELKRRKIKMPYLLNYYSVNRKLTTNDNISSFKHPITTRSKSKYIKRNEQLELVYPNQMKTILRNGLVGILLSLLFSFAVIASLFYLLHIIKKQKEIAEIKNDFINNITHEFKTPIATIGIANEAMRDFNILNDRQKTDEYLNITNNQVKKLNLMVEKVLETSTLDNENLLLQKELLNITEIIRKVIQKYKFMYKENDIRFTDNNSPIFANVDAFHFENVISNLMDNAIKYGENPIIINLQKKEEKINIKIEDNGFISKSQREKIFHKFYRIPKGDNHDIKGFGIGLYYAKKIIEKHNGTLELLPIKKTIFKITL